MKNRQNKTYLTLTAICLVKMGA